MEQQITPAQAYQEYFAPAIFGPLSEIVVEHASPKPGERVLDVACGTGILTRRIAPLLAPGGSLVGVDINPAMVEVATDLQSDGEVPVEYLQGDGIDLDLPAATFDLVVCQQGLQFFPDREAGVAEMRRVLKHGGRAVIATWQGLDRHPLYAALAAAEEPHLNELGVEIGREELVAPFSLEGSELRELVERAGFDRVELTEGEIEARFADADRFVERMEFAYGAVIPQFAEDPEAFRSYLEAISRATQHVVARYRRDDHIATPMHTNIVVAFS